MPLRYVSIACARQSGRATNFLRLGTGDSTEFAAESLRKGVSLCGQLDIDRLIYSIQGN